MHIKSKYFEIYLEKTNAPSSVQSSFNYDKDSLSTKLIQGRTRRIDIIFPLFAAIFQQCKVSNLIFYTAAFFWGGQCGVQSLWPMSKFWDTEYLTTTQFNILRYLKLIFLFDETPFSSNVSLIKEIVVLILNLLHFTLIITQLFYYNVHRNFIKILLWPIQMYDALAFILLLPCSYTLGESFLWLANGNRDMQALGSLILSVLNLSYLLTFHYFVLLLSSKSVSLQKIPYLSFDPFITYVVINTFCFFNILAFILMYFGDWCYLVAVALHIGCFTIYFIQTWNFLYISFLTNVLYFSMTISMVIMDITMFVFHFFAKTITYTPLIMIAAVAAGTLIAGHIFFTLRRRRIIRELTEDIEYPIEDKNDYFNSLKLLSTWRRSLMYLTVGFKHCCNYFTDMSLINYLAQNSVSDKLIANMILIVNYFPGENTILNRLTSSLMQNRNLSLAERFLIYQVYKVKILRQFSSSAESNEKLNELKIMSRQVETMTRGALDSTDLGPFFFEYLSVKAQRAHAIWNETLSNYPNNVKFCEEYCRYLVEAESNYPEALRIKHRGALIEMGKNYSVDYCFRSMVRLFPDYLKKGVVDLKGNLKKKKLDTNSTKDGRSTTSSSGSYGNKLSQDSSGDELDDMMQESIGKQVFNHVKARLALYRALENSIPRTLFAVIPIAVICVSAIVFLYIFVVLYTQHELSTQTNSMLFLDSISNTRFYIALDDLQIILRYSKDKKTYTQYEQTLLTLTNESGTTNIINFYADFLEESLSSLRAATTCFSTLIDLLASIQDREIIDKVSSNLFQNPYEVITCNGKDPVYNFNDTLATTISVFYAHQTHILTRSHEEITDMFTTFQFCELLANLKTFISSVHRVFRDFSDYQISEGEKLNKRFKIVKYVIPTLMAVTSIVPTFLLDLLIATSIAKIGVLIASFDQKTRADAKDQIYISENVEEVKGAENHQRGYRTFVLVFFLCCTATIFIAVCAIMTSIATDANKNIMNLNMWDQFATLRLSLAAELMNTYIFAVALHDNPNEASQLLSNSTRAAAMAAELLEQLIVAHDRLTLGYEGYPGCIGYDKTLDRLNYQDEELNNSIEGIHGYYAKAAVSTQIKILADLVNQSLFEIKSNDKKLTKTTFAHILHLFSAHLGPNLQAVTSRFLELPLHEYNKATQTIFLLLIPVFITLIVCIFCIVMYFHVRLSSYRAGLFILKRINPNSLINNKLFIKMILHNSTEVQELKRTVSGNIIHNAPDAILCTNIHGLIETVNPSTTTTLGYTPEQLLGHPVVSFFTQEFEEKMTQQMERMRDGQASYFYEDSITAVTDSNQLLPCHITIIGMKSHNSNSITSFVIILRDQSQLAEQQSQAEEAKRKSESLLYEILPRDIVVKINRGENNISFTVASATISFIDIVKFSEYSAPLTPQEIMANLSLYFGSIDKLLTKYEMITKIKLIGDIYMAAAGLFHPDTDPENHAEQMISFAIDVIHALDEINIRLNASLSVRVGVNSGGPIIAGVLGKDKPTFDIIGDPINVAARLQSTDEANYIQISQATYELIKGKSFDVHQRGDVFLKGKGKQTTYLVNASGLEGVGEFRVTV